jgi:cystathionine beta-lyase/cystathionine gamma-synthase
MTKPLLFFSEIYGGTLSFIDSILRKRRGMEIQNFNPEGQRYDLVTFERIVDALRPEIIYSEAISNPMLIVTDLEEVIEVAHKYGSKVIVDNTFATPALFKPLESGADLVIHSATKYFSGHGNISAGVLCGNDYELMRQAIEYRKFVGHMISPDDAYRLTTQVQSFHLRFRQQCYNAGRITKILDSNPVIGKVWYPGLKNHPTHPEAVKLFGSKSFGAMVTFDFEGDNPDKKRSRRDRFIKAVSEKIKLIPTLGDPGTILMPVESVWGSKYPEPGMIRLSVGFEETSGLEETITAALARVLEDN